MVNVEKLISTLEENHMSQRDMAKILGITDVTFYNKMHRKEFLLSEVSKILEVLTFRIDPMEIFFENVEPTILIEVKKKRYLPHMEIDTA